MSLHDTETLDGFVVYLVSCAILVGLVWTMQSVDIVRARKRLAEAMKVDLDFAQKCGRPYAPSIYSVYLTSDLQRRIERRRGDSWRLPVTLAAITFVLNGLGAALAWFMQ